MENENPAINLDNTGLVILYGRELESTLRKMGASGMGAGELANSIKANIPHSLFRDICFMISVRNSFAHAGTEDRDVPEDFDPEDYKEFAEGVIRRLKRLSASAGTSASPAPAEKTRAKKESEELTPEMAEFLTFKAELKRRARVLGCIPLFNWFYFLLLVFSSFKKASVPLLIILLSLMSLPPFINGFATQDNVHTACGAALAAAGYIWAITVFNNLPKKPAWYWWLPLCHLAAAAGLLCRLTDWKRFIFGAAGLSLDIAAVTVLFVQERPWKFFVIYTVTAFCLSLGHLIFYGPADRERDKN